MDVYLGVRDISFIYIIKYSLVNAKYIYKKNIDLNQLYYTLTFFLDPSNLLIIRQTITVLSSFYSHNSLILVNTPTKLSNDKTTYIFYIITKFHKNRGTIYPLNQHFSSTTGLQYTRILSENSLATSAQVN